MIIVIIIIKLRQIFECPPKFFQFKFPNTITYSPNKKKLYVKMRKKKNFKLNHSYFTKAAFIWESMS